MTKHILTAFFAISTLSNFAHAEQLTCDTTAGAYKETNKNYAFIWSDKISGAGCISDTTDHHNVKINGVGPGLRLNAVSGIIIDCPFVKNISGKYYGIKGAAAVIVGVQLGVFMRKEDGQVCVVGGGEVASLGASVVGAELTIN